MSSVRPYALLLVGALGLVLAPGLVGCIDRPTSVAGPSPSSLTVTPTPEPKAVVTPPAAVPSPQAPEIPPSAVPGKRPNFLVIITDDQRYDTVDGFMPRTQARIFQEGVRFASGYVTTPLCCPSRASILTGLYAHRHGVRLNSDPLHQTTFMQRLHWAGYFTGLVGKYLNSWDGSPWPEYDFWVAMAGGGSRYFNPRLNHNGVWMEVPGYMTYILRDYALRFLEQAAQQDKPFALIFAPNAPHSPYDPAPGDENLYPNLPPYRPPNYNESDVSDKPAWLPPPLSLQQQLQVDQARRRQLQMLWSLDQAVGDIINRLERQGKLTNTVIFYVSDNGFLWGEHRLRNKNRVYEPSIRVPFALRYLPLVSKGQTNSQLVANIDIAPTVYDLAGLSIPSELDGRSLVPLLRGQSVWREDLLIESWPSRAPYAAVHTSRYVYVETKGDRAELYDLLEDPHQLENRADDPSYASIVPEMKERLYRLRRIPTRLR